MSTPFFDFLFAVYFIGFFWLCILTMYMYDTRGRVKDLEARRRD